MAGATRANARKAGAQDVEHRASHPKRMPDPWFLHGNDFTDLLVNFTQPEWKHGALLALTGIEWGRKTATIPALFDKTHGVPWWVSCSKGPYKYIRTLDAGEIEELYQVEREPEELRNLALSLDFRPTIERFQEGAILELKRTQAPFVDRLPPVAAFEENIVDKIGRRAKAPRKLPSDAPGKNDINQSRFMMD